MTEPPKYCDLRGKIKRDRNGTCFAMNKPCKEVPDDVCKCLLKAYDIGRYDMIELEHRTFSEAYKNWQEFGDKYNRQDCPDKTNLTPCSKCGLCKELD